MRVLIEQSNQIVVQITYSVWRSERIFVNRIQRLSQSRFAKMLNPSKKVLEGRHETH